MDYNPKLKPWSRPEPNQVAGKGLIEKLDQFENIPWQSRSASPTAYEIELGDALVEAFSQGIEGLENLIAKLNELGTRAPDGAPWTTQTFEAEMARLGY